MKNIKMILSLVAAVLAVLSGGLAHAAGVGTTGGQFLRVGVGARPLAMGGAYSAVADDVNAINWNPGALGEIKERNATISYNSLFRDQNQGFMAYAAPLKDNMGTVAFGLNYLTVSNIEKRAGDTEVADSKFSNDNYALNASYGRSGIADNWSVGGNVKFVRESMDSFSASAVAIDAGTRYKTPVQNLTAGLSLLNLGTKLGPDSLPTTFKGGAAYQMFDKTLTLASDIDWLAMDKRLFLDLGAEYWANKALAIRTGYQIGRSQDKVGGLAGFGAGFGLRLDRYNIDYAFLPFGDLGDTHRITLGVRF